MEDLFIHGVGHKYHSRILDLFIFAAPMSTLPFGGCHGLLLGCIINNIILCIRGAIMAQHYQHWHIHASAGLTEVALYVGIDMVILA